MTANEIAGMRHTSASAQPDWCEVTRLVGEPTLDDDTLALEPGDTETVYAGPCRVRPRDSQEENVPVGDLHQTLSPYVGTLPAATTDAVRQAAVLHPGLAVEGDPNGVLVDDYLLVTVSSDPAMVGRAFQLTHLGLSAFQIDRRIGLRDREQPAGVEGGS